MNQKYTPPIRSERDQNIDMLRGAAMLYIVLIIHGLTTFHYLDVSSPILSAMLFEMPLIFFITGASNKYAPNRSVSHTIRSRFYRILLPYIVWTVFAIVALLLVRELSWKHLYTLSLINRNAGISSIYVNQIWFIFPYFIISLFIPFLKKVHESKQGVAKSGLIIVTLIWVISILDYLHLYVYGLRNVLCYAIFVILGFFYKDKHQRLYIVPLFIISAVCIILLLCSGAYSTVMQTNKFPPNLMFVFFGIFVICIIELFVSEINIPKVKVLDRWNRYGMEIYLYQNFAFMLISMMVVPIIKDMPLFIQLIITSSLLFFLLESVSPYIHKVNKYVQSIIQI